MPVPARLSPPPRACSRRCPGGFRRFHTPRPSRTAPSVGQAVRRQIDQAEVEPPSISVSAPRSVAPKSVARARVPQPYAVRADLRSRSDFQSTRGALAGVVGRNVHAHPLSADAHRRAAAGRRGSRSVGRTASTKKRRSSIDRVIPPVTRARGSPVPRETERGRSASRRSAGRASPSSTPAIGRRRPP
jgi:hypothetical protein